MVKARKFARVTKQKLFFSVTVDKCGSNFRTTKLRYELLTFEDESKTDYGAGLLPLCIGMPMMLKDDVAIDFRLANGSIGTVISIILDPSKPGQQGRRLQ